MRPFFEAKMPESFLELVWIYPQVVTREALTFSSSWIEAKNLLATASKASFGHAKEPIDCATVYDRGKLPQTGSKCVSNWTER